MYLEVDMEGYQKLQHPPQYGVYKCCEVGATRRISPAIVVRQSCVRQVQGPTPELTVAVNSACGCIAASRRRGWWVNLDAVHRAWIWLVATVR